MFVIERVMTRVAQQQQQHQHQLQQQHQQPHQDSEVPCLSHCSFCADASFVRLTRWLFRPEYAAALRCAALQARSSGSAAAEEELASLTLRVGQLEAALRQTENVRARLRQQPPA
jgi:hypothetical protein